MSLSKRAGGCLAWDMGLAPRDPCAMGVRFRPRAFVSGRCAGNASFSTVDVFGSGQKCPLRRTEPSAGPASLADFLPVAGHLACTARTSVAAARWQAGLMCSIAPASARVTCVIRAAGKQPNEVRMSVRIARAIVAWRGRLHPRWALGLFAKYRFPRQASRHETRTSRDPASRANVPDAPLAVLVCLWHRAPGAPPLSPALAGPL